MALTSLQVCMDSSDWLQGTLNEESGMDSSSPSGDMITCSRPLMERRLRPQHDQPLKCPRCDSAHTKFCYYNNYSLSQPRYFCKTCRRYWTKGGTLRNIPVGGGCRKNKKVANNNKKSPNDQQSLMNVQNCGSSSSNSHNSTDLHLSLPPEIQLSQLNCLMNGHGVFSSNNGFPDTSKFNIGMLENSTRPIDFIMESKLEAIVGNSRNYDFMGMNGDHHQFGALGGGGGGGGGIGDMSNNGFAQNFHGMCSPFGVSSIDGNNNGAFVDTCQRMMLPYYDQHHAQHEDDHNVIDVKPNPKLLSLEWQDQSCSDAGKNNSYGYYNNGIGSSWNGMMNDYNSSATNPMV